MAPPHELWAHRRIPLMRQAGVENPAAFEVFDQIDKDMVRHAESKLRAQLASFPAGMDAAHVAIRAIAAVREARHDLGAEAA